MNNEQKNIEFRSLVLRGLKIRLREPNSQLPMEN